jgi:hypothetical protein
MVRASTGQPPRRRSIMPRTSINRKYRPCFENFESKQLLSTGVLTHGAQALVQVQATVPVSSQAEVLHASPDGTGKGIVIITP